MIKHENSINKETGKQEKTYSSSLPGHKAVQVDGKWVEKKMTPEECRNRKKAEGGAANK